MRVSIIIPTYNRCSLLPAAVASARTAGAEVDIVVVDDASTDDTPMVCASLDGVKVIRLERNRGLAGARNEGIRAASGEWVAFLDDDDERLPGSLDRQMQRLRECPEAAMVYGPVTCRQDGTRWPAQCPQGDVFWRLVESNFIPVTSVIARKDALLAAGGFDETLRVVEDWDLWLRLTDSAPVAAVDEPVAVYNVASAGSGQLSSNRIRMSLACAKVQARALNSARASEVPAAQRKAARTRLLRRHWYELTLAAMELLLAGQQGDARRHLNVAFRLQPVHALGHAGFRRLYLGSGLTTLKPAEVKAIRKAVYAELAEFEKEVRAAAQTGG